MKGREKRIFSGTNNRPGGRLERGRGGMNWNDSSYWYWRERGGEFFSSMVWRDSGILFLDMPMGPALIQCELVPGRSGMLHREIAITSGPAWNTPTI